MKKTSSLYVFFILFWLAALVKLDWTITETVNITFMVGLIALMGAASIKVLQSGFLALFLDGFRRIGQSLAVRSHAMERAEEQLKNDVSLREFKQQTARWLFHAITACSVVSMAYSLIGLIVYY